MFTDEKSRCLGEIKIAFDCVFRATSSWVIDNFWPRRTETDVGALIFNTSRALLRAGRTFNILDSKKQQRRRYYMPLSV